MYEKGALESGKGASIEELIVGRERNKKYELTTMDRLRFRTRYFSDSGIIGTKSFVMQYYEMFKSNFGPCKSKKPKKIAGFDGVYSLKRLINDV